MRARAKPRPKQPEAADRAGQIDRASGIGRARRLAARNSLLLLALLALFCATTRWGGRYVDLVSRSYHALRIASARSVDERKRDLLDETYPLLLYIREFTPPDAVILFPPHETIVEHFGGDYSRLITNATSAYSVIYPRIPVHFGDPSPLRDRLTHVFVWEHAGLDLVQPGAAKTEENRFGVFPLPAGARVTW